MRSVFLVLLLLGSAWHSFAQKATELLPVKQNGQWGYITTGGNMVIEPQFDAAGYFDLHLMARVVKDGKIMFISYKDGNLQELKTGRVESYDDLEVITSQLIAFKVKNKWGITNWQGDDILPAEYSRFNVIQYGKRKMILTQKDTFYGLMDTMGKVVLPTEYANVVMGYNGIAAKDGAREIKNGRQPSLWMLFDYDGNRLLDFWSKAIYEKTPITWNITKGTVTYVYTTHNKKLTEVGENLDFTPVPLHPQYYYITGKQGLGIINKSGKRIIEPRYHDVQIRYGYFYTYIDRKMGISYMSGNTLIEPAYDQISKFDEHVALVRNGKKWGLINDKGIEIVPPIYTTIDVAGNSAKCSKSYSEVDIYELDDNGDMLDKMEYNNVLTVSANYRSTYTRTFNSRTTRVRNINTGWFYASAFGLWGYRSNNYEEKLEPQFTKVKDLPHLKMAIVEVRLEEPTIVRMGEAVFQTYYRYGIISTETFNYIYKPIFAYIDIEPFDKRDFQYTRALLPEGKFMVLTFNGFMSRQKYAYIGKQVNGVSRFTIDGKFRINRPYSRQTPILPYGTTAALMDDLSNVFPAMNNFWWLPRSTYMGIQPDTRLKVKDVLEVRDAKWGYLGTNGFPTGKPEYDMAYDFYKESAIAVRGGKYGVVGKNGKPLMAFRYQNIDYLGGSDSLLYQITSYKPKQGIIDSFGNVKVPIDYYKLMDISNGIALYRDRNSTYGYVNLEGKEIVDTTLRLANPFTDKLTSVKIRKYWSLVDVHGNFVLETKYRRMGAFSEGLVSVYDAGKFGYLDETGELIIPAIFRYAGEFKNGYAIASKNKKKYGFIDKEGNWLVKPKYSRMEDFDHNGLAIVQTKRGKGVINNKGEKLIKPKYTRVTISPGGEIVVNKSTSAYLYNHKTEELMPLGKMIVEPFKNGYAIFRQGGKCGVIDTTGKIIQAAAFSKCSNVSEGYFAAKYGSKFLILNIKGDTMYTRDFLEFEGDFYKGKLLVNDGEYYWFMSITGENVFDRVFTDAKPYVSGVALVKYNRKYGVINNSGQEIVEDKYDEIFEFKEGYARVAINYNMGVATNDGKTIFEPEYDWVSYVNGLFRVEWQNAIGYINKKGSWLWTMNE